MNKKAVAVTVVPLSVIVIVGVVLGMVFVAPGFSLNSTSVGSNVVSTAQKKINDDLSKKEIEIQGEKFNLSELGFHYDDKDVDNALKNNKAWKVSTWNKSQTIPLKLDSEKAETVLSERLEDYKNPVNAKISKDKGGFKVKKGKNGYNLDMKKLEKTVNEELIKNNKKDVSLNLEKLNPQATTKTAKKFLKELTKQADKTALYSSDHKILDVSTEQFNSFVKVSEKDGKFSVSVNENKVSDFVDSLPEKVNKKVDNGSAVVDDDGNALKILNAYNDGFEIEGLDNLKESMSDSILKGDTKISVEGKYEKAKVDKKNRRAEVDLSKRRAYLFENDKKVAEFPVAIGKPATPTDVGKFKVFIQYEKKDMGCKPGFNYCTKDVPWASFYNRGEAFHGAPWHNDFGNPSSSARSHGCVNMRVADAHKVYKFLQVGSTVEVKR